MSTKMNSLSQCLREEASAISAAADRLSSLEVEKALDLLTYCIINKEKLIITGVGKSGIVARKIAATFSSIGLMSLYLNPLDALHGDLGIVSENDVCLLMSNSGETLEILQIIPHLKRRKTKTIALVGKKDSTLAKEADVVLFGGVDKEVCPLNLAPTASTAVAMAIGDALAAVLMERQSISSSDFALNHPAGQLGKQLTLTVGDLKIPISEVPSITTESVLEEIIFSITENGIGCSWVEDPSKEGEIIGIITDGDLRRALKENQPKRWNYLLAKDLMTKNPITINHKILVIEAIEMMEINRKKPITVMPITNNKNKLIGFLKLHDLIQAGLT